MQSEINLPAPPPKSETRQPKYSEVADALRRQIISGELRPGDRLPSYSEGKIHGITQQTIQRAHSILEREGLIFRKLRSGTFVAHCSTEAPQKSNPRPPSLMQHTVGVITNETGREFPELKMEGWMYVSVQEVSEQLRRLKLNALMLQPESIQTRDISLLRNDPPLGFVLTDTGWTEEKLQELVFALKMTGAPVVINGDQRLLQNCDRVASDHAAGAYKLTKWLIEQRGRRRILNLWPAISEQYWLTAKWRGYERAVLEAGLEAMDPRIVTETIVPEDVDEAWLVQQSRLFAGELVEYLAGKQRVDAIMAHTDYVAMIVAASCRLFGLEPNVDVDIVGYDNYGAECALRRFEPCLPIATVDKRNRLIGRQLVDLLSVRLERSIPDDPQRVLVDPILVTSD